MSKKFEIIQFVLLVIMEKRSLFNTKDCRTCKIIRSFILAVLMLGLMALLVGDKMHYLRFITIDLIGVTIIVSGACLFFVKLYLWKKEQASK